MEAKDKEAEYFYSIYSVFAQYKAYSNLGLDIFFTDMPTASSYFGESIGLKNDSS